ncbi:N-acetyltransferase family protein [Sphingopyxis panaciterrae]
MTTVPGTRRATLNDLESVAQLFDLYRQFYGRAADPAESARFIEARLAQGDSIILIAELDGRIAGFTQLFPSFSSLGMAPIHVLNDLYVAAEARGNKVGKALIDAAADLARKQGAVRLTLSTETSNARAQHVYETGGWQREVDFYTYNLKLVD